MTKYKKLIFLKKGIKYGAVKKKKWKCLVSKISVSQEPELNWDLEANYFIKKKKKNNK